MDIFTTKMHSEVFLKIKVKFIFYPNRKFALP